MEGYKHCPHCGAPLHVGELPRDTAARCSECCAEFLVSMMRGQGDSSGDTSLAPNRRARLSLIFGALSVVTFTGLLVGAITNLVPRTVAVGVAGSGLSVLFGVSAIACGVVGIRDGRRADTQLPKASLVGGMLMGTVFGLGCGLCGVSGSILGPKLRPSTDQADIDQALAEIGSFEVPDGIEPVRTQAVLSIRQLRWEDAAHGSEINMTYYPAAFAMNEAAARSQSASMRAADTADLPKLSDSDKFRVESTRDSVEIRVETGRDKSVEYVYYSGYLKHTDGWVYVRVLVKTSSQPPDPAITAPVLMTREQVQHFFESYTPPEK